MNEALTRSDALRLNAVAGVLAGVARATRGSETVPVAWAPQEELGSGTAPAGMANARVAPPTTASDPAALAVRLTTRFMISPWDGVT